MTSRIIVAIFAVFAFAVVPAAGQTDQWNGIVRGAVEGVTTSGGATIITLATDGGDTRTFRYRDRGGAYDQGTPAEVIVGARAGLHVDYVWQETRDEGLAFLYHTLYGRSPRPAAAPAAPSRPASRPQAFVLTVGKSSPIASGYKRSALSKRKRRGADWGGSVQRPGVSGLSSAFGTRKEVA